MSSSSSNKRKIGDEGAAASSRLAPALRKDAAASPEPRNDEHLNHHLPAPIWAHALDYLPYEEVRSALLLCKMIADEASTYVLALNFTKSCQIDGPSARSRFPNVEEVNVLCLFLPDTDETGSETVDRIVPFLTTIAKLRIINFKATAWRYHPSQNEVLRALFKNILGSLKARALPNSIESIDGLFYCMAAFRGNNGRCQPGCTICRDVCSYFPLRGIIDQETGEINYQGSCLDDLERYRILLQRPGGRDATRELLVTGTKLFCFLEGELMYYYLWYHDDGAEALKEKLEKLGAFSDELDEHTVPIQYMDQRGFNSLDGLLGLGFDPKFVSRGDLYHLLSDNYERGGHGHRVIAKSTFDFLVSRGFDLDRKDVNVFDEKDEPALRKRVEMN